MIEEQEYTIHNNHNDGCSRRIPRRSRISWPSIRRTFQKKTKDTVRETVSQTCEIKIMLAFIHEYDDMI